VGAADRWFESSRPEHFPSLGGDIGVACGAEDVARGRPTQPHLAFVMRLVEVAKRNRHVAIPDKRPTGSLDDDLVYTA
jgi:hypothetical protein